MNYKDIKKELREDDNVKWFLEATIEHAIDWKGKIDWNPLNKEMVVNEISAFYKVKINQIIDEMIGEEITMNYNYREGYNMKVEELKKYKRIFNK